MKTNYLIVLLLALSCCAGSCSKDKAPASATTLLGERTCSGTIVSLPNPPSEDGPTLPGMVLGIGTTSEEYILTCNGAWLADGTITVDGKAYVFEVGDEAEITGMVSKTRISSSQEYFELEIKTINKIHKR